MSRRKRHAPNARYVTRKKIYPTNSFAPAGTRTSFPVDPQMTTYRQSFPSNFLAAVRGEKVEADGPPRRCAEKLGAIFQYAIPEGLEW